MCSLLICFGNVHNLILSTCQVKLPFPGNESNNTETRTRIGLHST